MVSRIYQFPNGDAVDLHKVNSIGSFGKEANGNLFIPVYYERSSKPVKYIVGYANGETPEEIKIKVFGIFQMILNTWSDYLLNQKANGKDN